MATKMYYLAGEKLNLLERAVTAPSMTPAAAASFPATALYDQRPSQIAKFGSAAADCRVDIDTNLVTNGGFETSTLSGWTDSDTGNGASTETTTAGEFVSGAKALKLDTVDVAGVAERYQDIVVRAGERLTFRAQMRKTAAGTAAVVGRIKNLSTGKWLTSAGAWDASTSDALTTTSTTFGLQSRAFTVESWTILQASTVTLRIYFRKASAGAAAEVGLVDDVELIPDVNFCSIHGHNIDPLIAVQLRSSTDNFSGVDTLEATLSMKQPSFFGVLSTPGTARRYWRLKLSGTNTAAPYIGELVLGYAEEITKRMRQGWTIKWRKAQSRTRTRAGEQFVTALGGGHPHRIAQWQFRHASEATMLELRDQILRRTLQGEHAAVIVPVDTEDVVMFGRFTEEWEVAREFPSMWDSDAMFEEAAFPAVTS